MNYHTSTQKSSWTFTLAEITALAAVANVADLRPEEVGCDNDGGWVNSNDRTVGVPLHGRCVTDETFVASSPSPVSSLDSKNQNRVFSFAMDYQGGIKSEDVPKPTPATIVAASPGRLTSDEESILIRFWSRMLLLCSPAIKHSHSTHLQRPSSVLSTAYVYFRRFYLSNTVHTHPPQLIALSSLFLASKVLDCQLGLKELTLAAKEAFSSSLEISDVLLGEKKLMEGIGFTFMVHLPLRPLKGVVGDVIEYLGAEEDEEGVRMIIEKAYVRAVEVLEEGVFSDIVLVTSPSEIAIGAFLLGLEEQGVDLEDTAAVKVKREKGNDGGRIVTPIDTAASSTTETAAISSAFPFDWRSYLRSRLSSNDFTKDVKTDIVIENIEVVVLRLKAVLTSTLSDSYNAARGAFLLGNAGDFQKKAKDANKKLKAWVNRGCEDVSVGVDSGGSGGGKGKKRGLDDEGVNANGASDDACSDQAPAKKARR